MEVCKLFDSELFVINGFTEKIVISFTQLEDLLSSCVDVEPYSKKSKGFIGFDRFDREFVRCISEEADSGSLIFIAER